MSEPSGEVETALVVGTGLIGTSVALALEGSGVHVYLADRDPRSMALAVELGAGSAEPPGTDPDVVVVAVPPEAVGPVIVDQSRSFLSSSIIDLASVKSQPLAEAQALGADSTRLVGGHPLAGRERAGAGGARADLFQGSPWVLTPTPQVTQWALARAHDVVRRCGAVAVTMSAEQHDRAVGLVSHAPQVVASLMAARLADAGEDLVALSGQGIRDVTRIAASDPALWTQILSANAPAVHAVLRDLAADLAAAADALERPGDPDAAVLADLLVRGNRGRARIPGKHGAAPAAYLPVPVVVADRPGELARLLVAAGDAGVNVEDIVIEHSPGRPVGLVELAVRPEVAALLAAALREQGWSVHL